MTRLQLTKFSEYNPIEMNTQPYTIPAKELLAIASIFAAGLKKMFSIRAPPFLNKIEAQIDIVSTTAYGYRS